MCFLQLSPWESPLLFLILSLVIQRSLHILPNYFFRLSYPSQFLFPATKNHDYLWMDNVTPFFKVVNARYFFLHLSKFHHPRKASFWHHEECYVKAQPWNIINPRGRRSSFLAVMKALGLGHCKIRQLCSASVVSHFSLRDWPYLRHMWLKNGKVPWDFPQSCQGDCS